MTTALQDVRVLDLSRFIAGPTCAMLLGDMGADVVKVEKPGGEEARQNAPFANGHSIYTMTFNRNKRAVTVDPRKPGGREVLARLAGWADVVVENYRPGTLEQMGLGYEDLRRRNEGIILTSISGFGQTGPYRDRAVFDPVAQAMSGLMYRNGQEDDPPLFAGVFVADYLAGVFAAFGTALALFHRERTGKGQVVDLALLDALFSIMGIQTAQWLLNGERMPRTGNRDLYTAPANVFGASDGYVYLHGGTQALFERLVTAMDRRDLLDDSRLSSAAGRMRHVEELEELVGAWVRGQTVAEVCEQLEAAGIPYGPVDDVDAAVGNPQLRAREMIAEIEHLEAGRVVVPGVVTKLSETPGTVRLPPPTVGQDNQEVFCDLLGLSAAELAELQAEGAV
jgi:crotonobetainyl-CoA:carnitine CoA-transferase CaiB-like acyl-CoA transferase